MPLALIIKYVLWLEKGESFNKFLLNMRNADRRYPTILQIKE